MGSIKVAMRTSSSTLNFLLGDHLGSNAITTSSSGVKNSEIRYMPWGTTRYTSGSSPTTIQYTGQRVEASLGLLFYNARWYDAAAGRFLQADTVVPGGVQGLDRYAYANNNPINFTDPSGHAICNDDGECTLNGQHVDSIKFGHVDPWMKYDKNIKYDYKSDSITNWGSDQSNNSDISRADKVLNWICSSGGWWGSGCPSAQDLASWLLQHEGAEMLEDSVYTKGNGKIGTQRMITYFHFLFSDGINSEDLGKMTAFFNPDGISPFSRADWNMLLTEPDKIYYEQVDKFWEQNYLPTENGNIISKWWEPNEHNSYHQASNPVFNPSTGDVIMYFGYP